MKKAYRSTISSGESRYSDGPGSQHEVRLLLPWWASPVWGICLLGLTTSTYSVLLPAEDYSQWGVEKYFDWPQYWLVVLGILCFGVASVVFGGTRRSRTFVISFGKESARSWLWGYRVLFALTLFGYLYWAYTAVSQGVSLSDLARVLDRENAAVSELKANSHPVAGLTTFTQMGPIVVGLGYLLRSAGIGGRGWFVVVFLAAVRSVFYAERLAIIEILVPLAVLLAAEWNARRRRLRTIRYAPFYGAGAAWAIFAASEYFRSWVFYQNYVSTNFFDWVTQRLLGYYVTAFNNSAIFLAHGGADLPAPYFSFTAFWNAPGVSHFLPYDLGGGLTPEDWWTGILRTYGDPELNSIGSFVTSFAELGILGMACYWVCLGALSGILVSRIKSGSIAAVLLYACSFVGLLEVPRFIYWTQGRFFPVIVGFVLLVLTAASVEETRRRLAARRSVSGPASEISGVEHWDG